MSGTFAKGKKAKALCDVCGFTYKLSELKPVIVRGNKTSIKACPICWDVDHPQNMLGRFRITDPQALRDPRPATAELGAVRGIVVPVKGVAPTVQIGDSSGVVS